MLDPVLHLWLHLACGALRTSPVESLYVECNKQNLQRQRAYTHLLDAFKIYPCLTILINQFFMIFL